MSTGISTSGVFFTGLSGSGKSTVASVLQGKLLEIGGRSVTISDGDEVRKLLSSELGFSRGISTSGASADHQGSPSARRTTRCAENAQISAGGGYQMVHISTPIEVCEQRDCKGLHAKTRAGVIKEFTAVSDPYEVPDDADVVIDTTDITPEEAAQQILLHLQREGYIGPRED